MMILPLLLLLNAPGLAEPPSLVNCDVVVPAFERAKREALPNPRQIAVAEFTTFASFCHGWTVIHVMPWATINPQKRDGWLVRRQQMNIRGERAVEWADSERCPELLNALESLGRISVAMSLGPIRPVQPGKGVRPPVPQIDGNQYTLSVVTAWQPDGSSARVSLSAGNGPLARWAEQDLETLNKCWRPTLD